MSLGALRVKRWLAARGVQLALPEQCGYVPVVESADGAADGPPLRGDG